MVPYTKNTRLMILLLLTVVSAGGLGLAMMQVIGYDGKDGQPTNHFSFARVYFNSYRSWGRNPGWAHDYPYADRNLLRILEEVTFIKTNRSSYYIVALTDPGIMRFPLLYFSEPGTWAITVAEAENFRRYLQRGGFAIFDDFEGPRDWENFEYCMDQVMPGRKMELLTIEHPIFHSFFDIKTLDVEVPATVRVWEGPQFYGMTDEKGRLQVIANFNNDIGDFWEWSEQGYYPIPLTNEAYRFGVNYIIYALSH